MSSDKLFFGTILAMFVAMTGHPWIALVIFWLSII
jgi:phosphatidylglycerophosphate synthase